MINEYYGTATTPTEDFLAHYGIKGMKWGVRKAIASGNSKKLGRQYAKAQKKLAKLEKRANNRSKYVKRAAALGAGAAVAGGLAALGTRGVSSIMAKTGAHGGKAMVGVGNAMSRAGSKLSSNLYNLGKAKNSGVLKKIGAHGGQAMIGAGNAISKAGSGMSAGLYKGSHAVRNWGAQTHDVANYANRALTSAGHGGKGAQLEKALNKAGIKNVSNNALVRLGAGAVGAGLGASAAYNAYRAATTKRAAKKAAAFRAEMNKAFAGTQYANGGRPASQKKHRRK